MRRSPLPLLFLTTLGACTCLRPIPYLPDVKPAAQALPSSEHGFSAHPRAPRSTATPAATVAALSTCPRARSLAKAAVEAEISCLLSLYVQLDTTNPPGNEARATAFLRALLARDGVEAMELGPVKERQNLIARIPGASSTGAVVLMHHTDVVPAEAQEWSQAPLSGVIADGQLYGRGALDDKGPGIVGIVTALLFKRMGVTPPRDILILATADEEAGGKQGIHFLLAHHQSLFDGVAFVLNEGGIIALQEESEAAGGTARIEVAQKAPLWLELTAHGPSGHGSTPRPEAASHRLVQALSRLLSSPAEVRVVPEVQTVFAERAASAPESLRGAYRDLRTALTQEPFRGQFLADPRQAALVQNTLSVTMLAGSDKENVFSPTASALLDMRLLPGEDPQRVIAQVRATIADPNIDVTPRLSFAAPPSPATGPLFTAVRALMAERYPSMTVTTNVIGGFTDCNAFRSRGIDCYGFMPMPLSTTAFSGVHGKDERVPLDALVSAVSNLHRLLTLLPVLPGPGQVAVTGAAKHE